MDARARLRRYLEQRRELGESELVLDRLNVDELMALLGAPDNVPQVDSARSGGSPGEHMVALGKSHLPPSARDADAGTRAAEDAPRDPPPDPAPPDPAPPDPAPRFAPDTTTDWRTALRGAGAAPKPAPRLWTQALGIDAGLQVGSAESLGAEASDARLRDLGTRGSVERQSPTLDDIRTAASLDDLAMLATNCTRCDLHRFAKRCVPGAGNPQADFVCVGEAPGQNEDEQGLPFVGAAGDLLTRILLAIQLERRDVFVVNVLKHRPPENRDPLPDEVSACTPFLRRQLVLLQPRVILALGRFAAQTLLETTTPIGKLRGQLHHYHGIPLIVTYHPAALLRNESWKRPTWDDVRLARRVLDASREASRDASGAA